MNKKNDIIYLMQDVRLRVGRLYWISITFVCFAGLFEGISLLFLVPLISALLPDSNVTHSSIFLYDSLGPLSSYLKNPIFAFSMFIICAVFQYSLMISQYYFSSKAQESYVWQWRNETIENLLKARWSHFSNKNDHEISNLIITTLPKLGIVIWNLIQAVSTFFSILIYMLIALFISWQMTVLMLAVGAILLPVVLRYINRVTKVGVETDALEKSLNNWCLEIISGIKFIKSSGSESYAFKHFKEINKKMSKIGAATFFQSNMIVAVYQGTMILMLVLSLLVSVKLIGVHFVNVLVVMALFSRLYPRYTLFNNFLYAIKLNIHALDKIKQINNEAIISQEFISFVAKDKSPMPTSLNLVDVSVQYNTIPVLQHVDMNINQGDFIAIVGESGAGKTTLVDTILGLVPISSGAIYLNNENLADSGFVIMRHITGYVSQDAVLFNATIEENIAWGNREVDSALVQKAAIMADAHEYILNTENGYKANIGDRGEKLSGGQRQRLAIARALYRDKQILILDEATSALDKCSEQEILKTVLGLKGRVTIIMITHKQENALLADKVYTISHGRVCLKDMAQRPGVSLKKEQCEVFQN